MRFIFAWLFIIFMLGMFGAGKALYHSDNTQDIYNITEKISWNESLFQRNEEFNFQEMDNSDIMTYRLMNILYKGIDTMGFIAFEVAKFGVEVGFRNPDWNYFWLAKWLFVILVIGWIAPALFWLSLLLYIIYRGINNWIKDKKRKKRKLKIS